MCVLVDVCVCTRVQIGVRWSAAPPVVVSHGPRLTLTHDCPLLAYTRQPQAQTILAPSAAGGGAMASASASRAGPSQLIMLQRLLDVDAVREAEEDERARGKGHGTGVCACYYACMHAEGGIAIFFAFVGKCKGAPACLLTRGLLACLRACLHACADDDDDEEEEDLGPVQGVVQPGDVLLPGKLYMQQVHITNNSERQQAIDVTLQAPQGAVVLGAAPALWTRALTIPAYSAQQLRQYFYFPNSVLPVQGTGSGGGGDCYEAASFPATAARRGRLLAMAADVPPLLRVADASSATATAAAAAAESSTGSGNQPLSWRRACELMGTEEGDRMRLALLGSGDLAGMELERCGWRCRQSKTFWQEALVLLRARGCFHPHMW